MKVEDIPDVLQIDRLSFPIPWTERNYRYEVTENRASRMMVCEEVAPDSPPRIIGYVGSWLIVDEVHISTLAVHPSFRQRNIAEKLLRTLLICAGQDGAVLATLEVRSSNVPALRLYKKLGFKVVGVRQGYYRDNREDALLMTLHGVEQWAYSGVGEQL
jgi:ribosomal-protein-alanine N-acetyltransferase